MEEEEDADGNQTRNGQAHFAQASSTGIHDLNCKFSWLYMMKSRSEALSIFRAFRLQVENLFDRKIKFLQSDGAKEFLSHAFQAELQNNGIFHHISCPHVPQQNSFVEHSPGHDGGVTSPASRVVSQSDDSTNSAQITQANNPAPQRTHSMEPRTFSKAQKDPHWRAAMEEEFQVLINNHTWDLVPAPPSRNIIGCKWVYRIK
ncbi:hypothetical protein CRG98_033459 [Punica granatum]|uniref:Integrase catalytic domain-containing protein n=1 Tax=Punica granatum TaxID=22663 RepID=A0A2I0IRR0_PUNGR|nr:hypothetical protein CRG98_033459 [Punica granatum]